MFRPSKPVQYYILESVFVVQVHYLVAMFYFEVYHICDFAGFGKGRMEDLACMSTQLLCLPQAKYLYDISCG